MSTRAAGGVGVSSSAAQSQGQGGTNEPKDSKFKQQALPAWQPILTAGTVLPAFFVIGVAFIPIGVGLMYFSNQVHEAAVEYTDCMDVNNPQVACKDQIMNYTLDQTLGWIPPKCTCNMEISKEQIGDDDWTGQVFIYYGLTNFYQNHRRYVKSRDDKQLYGDLSSTDQDCDPFLNPPNDTKVYAPCGAIANSLFNDTITLQYRDNPSDNWKNVPVIRTGIAWDSDKKYKFKNPQGKNSIADLKESFKNTVKPMDWQKNIWELDEVNEDNNGFLNEDLIVWMRTAALPNFRKLYRKIDMENTADPTFKEGLPKDKEYRLHIDYNYKVAQFSGTKKVILATTSLMGGKNPFLGIAYIVVGCICFLMGVVFLFIHLRFGRTTQEMMNIGPRSQYNAN